MLHGKGKMIYKDGDQYDGDWMNNQRHGAGRMIFANKDIYQGQWSQNEKHGKGTYRYANGTKIEGKFANNEPTETCSVTRLNGKIKHVEFKRGQNNKDTRMEVKVSRWVKNTEYK